jgi:hypothetical protein
MPTKLETIELKLNSSNQWLMKVGSGGWQAPPYPELVVGQNEAGVFTFTIVGSGNAKFAGNAFVQKANANPNKPDFADQFIAIPRGDKELIVVDTNQSKGGGPYPGGKYVYELNFVGAPPLDPIITNNGCCQLYSTGELIAYGLAFAALCALAVVGFRNWRARHAAASPRPGGTGGGSSPADPNNDPGPR